MILHTLSLEGFPIYTIRCTIIKHTPSQQGFTQHLLNGRFTNKALYVALKSELSPISPSLWKIYTCLPPDVKPFPAQENCAKHQLIANPDITMSFNKGFMMVLNRSI
ncbi:hypothetical protein NPIL_5111 [Nephila pilipes]|uniref:Uncharacterized protein n=1 Tax=Nephila pilipes TaxID=299642 RepID=A0A8X6UP99_NEPPI|nr:hypothetical protein NPIL_5111 [Nephila pilipes]